MVNTSLQTGTKLSLLWTVIMFNMLFADVFSIIIEITQSGVLDIPLEVNIMMGIAAILTNIPILMILFSRILNYKWNRILNIIASVFTIIYVVGGGHNAPHYIIMASIEIFLLLIILKTAFSWKEDDLAVIR